VVTQLLTQQVISMQPVAVEELGKLETALLKATAVTALQLQ
jgi:hypothetical protein